jgi:hypothetical protein
MFQAIKFRLSSTTYQYKITENDQQLTYAQVIGLWQNSADFRQFYNQILIESEFEAYFWENPSIDKKTIYQPYEFVLVNSTALAKIQALEQAFLKYFSQNVNGIVTFDNLQKDALLIVPSPLVENSDYSHISAFVRNAPNEQLQAFWRQIGKQIKGRISDKKLWVSTSGLGVYWLHVRLDDRPKYYQHRLYK